MHQMPNGAEEADMNSDMVRFGLDQLDYNPNEPGPPNLDALCTPDGIGLLRGWGKLVGQYPETAGLLMFPGVPDEHERAAATCDLASYAEAKARAIRLRLDGEMDQALLAEADANGIYRRLPVWARW